MTAVGLLGGFFKGAPAPTRLLLTRAGPVENPGGVLYSHPGLPLAGGGEQALQALAARLRRSGVKRVYAADSQAEASAARLLAEELGVPYELEQALRERSWGEWEGLSFAEVSWRWPAALAAWARDEAGFTPPGGESLELVESRSRPVLKDILSRHDGTAALLVGNCAVNRVALRLALPFFELGEGLRFEFDYASLSELRFYGSEGVLARLNERAVLELA
jgi:broad specificity phosphatase PhoE